MALTNIGWTAIMHPATGESHEGYTFNPWRGCEKVSPGCKHCYAEELVTGRQGLAVWGRHAPRRIAAESTWMQPLMWQRKARAAGVALRVFSGSLCDIFEDYQGPSEEVRAKIQQARGRLFRLIENTPDLDWLLLTKRPENVMRLVPIEWLANRSTETGKIRKRPSHSLWPGNAWIGCTVEDQQRATERLPHLMQIPAPIRFVSYEPALEPVDFRPWLNEPGPRIDWLIAGGESGSKAREFHEQWARDTLAMGQQAKIPVFVKQLGAVTVDTNGLVQIRSRRSKGDDVSLWPEDLRVQESPPVRRTRALEGEWLFT